MNVRIVDGRRVIEATKPELACMKKAAGLFRFVWDNMETCNWHDLALDDVGGLMRAAIEESDPEFVPANVAEKAGETT